MTERKTESLTLRLPERLQAEIERIAARRGLSASEVGRELLEHGARVERLIEAQELQRSYEAGRFDRTDGRVEIEARFRHFSRLEREQQNWDYEDWEQWQDQQEAQRKESSGG